MNDIGVNLTVATTLKFHLCKKKERVIVLGMVTRSGLWPAWTYHQKGQQTFKEK